jgi:hypothetical protein
MNLRTSVASALLLLASSAQAESFFQAEVGLGAVVRGSDLGDDVWQQKKGVPDSEKLTSPAFIIGVSAGLFSRRPFDLRGHLDYTYAGQQRASCMCVSDADYYAARYNGPRYAFNGFGHVQGVSLTLEPGYSLGPWRFSVEAGPWVNWATWHETALLPPPQGSVNASHRATPQFGWVFGAGIARGPFALHYRYYQVRQPWNPNPGLVTGLHLLYLSWSF